MMVVIFPLCSFLFVFSSSVSAATKTELNVGDTEANVTQPGLRVKAQNLIYLWAVCLHLKAEGYGRPMGNELQTEGFVRNLLCEGKVGHIEQSSTAGAWTNISKLPRLTILKQRMLTDRLNVFVNCCSGSIQRWSDAIRAV